MLLVNLAQLARTPLTPSHLIMFRGNSQIATGDKQTLKFRMEATDLKRKMIEWTWTWTVAAALGRTLRRKPQEVGSVGTVGITDEEEMIVDFIVMISTLLEAEDSGDQIETCPSITTVAERTS